jgi:DNA-binding GntR family transcriptional regulator
MIAEAVGEHDGEKAAQAMAEVITVGRDRLIAELGAADLAS